MTERRVSTYWRVSWGFITPVILVVIFIYSAFNFENPTFAHKQFPIEYLTIGWTIFIIGVSQVLIWFLWSVSRDFHQAGSDAKLVSLIKKGFTPSSKWGPKNEKIHEGWTAFKTEAKQKRELMIQQENHSWIQQKIYVFTGKYSNL